jgi:predicted outer membrane repeat protein
MFKVTATRFMKICLSGMACLLAAMPFNVAATAHYVSVNSTNPTPPYISWATAATNIQDTMNYAASGDTVLVTNGVYQYGGYSLGGSNRVNVLANVTLQSINGPVATVIAGYQVPGTTNGISAMRCVYLQNGSTLSGFTLTNGATQTSGPSGGGGVYCASTNAAVTNCIIMGNAGVQGGGAFGGTLMNCILASNTAIGSSGLGGGADNSMLINCLIFGNRSGYIAGAAVNGTLLNCTVVSNSAAAYYGAIDGSVVDNSIVYYNYSYNTTPDVGTGTFYNCCLFISTTSSYNSFTNAPAFLNLAADDYHLSPTSLCINAGNNSFVSYGTDLDGNPRIVGGTVDIGAYEYQARRYVNQNSASPVSPFTTWSTAATNIQDAVDSAIAGDEVIVTNGVYVFGGRPVSGYSLTNRVAVAKPIVVQSVNGPAVTAIQGKSPIGNNAARCVYLTNGASLIGFTLTNGAVLSSGNIVYDLSAGGLLCDSLNAMASNCVIIGNSAEYGGGAVGGTLINCTIAHNSASWGGGVYGLFDGNGVSNLLIGCLIVSNTATSGGGAIYSTLNGCLLSSNSASMYEGGGAYQCALNDCIVANNWAGDGGGGAYLCNLINCTIVSNISAFGGGGGTMGGNLYNCIVFYNTGGTTSNFNGGNLLFSCTSPLSPGNGNITNVPLFVSVAAGDFHLQSNSPCINSGNNSYVSTNTDFDGNPRIAGGTVDIGAYEYQTPTSIISYAWLQEYGLATDGSADFIDSDGDGMNNWQEWIAGTNPTNAASVLQMTSVSNSVSGVTVTWQSVSGINYFIQRSTNLSVLPAFAMLQTNLVGQVSLTSYTDTTATNGGAFFYRVGVQ